MAWRFRIEIRQAWRGLALVFVLLALANGTAWFAFTRKVVREYDELRRESEQYNRIVERRDEVELRVKYLDALVKVEEDLRYLRDEVLSTRAQRLVDVQGELAELAGRFQINLAAVDYSNEPLLEEELDRLVIAVPLAGDYIALRRFLEAVEQSDKFLLVESVALARGKEGDTALQLNITLATYFNLPEELIRRKRELERRSRSGRSG
jgi:hypothetical protein